MRTIAIVGGGFSGTMVAVNLVRLGDEPLRIVIINSKRPLGRGTAYGTQRREHLLNVAARNMSALPDMPSHFVDWLQTRSEYSWIQPDELRDLFAPRQVYGDYIRGLLGSCLSPICANEKTKVVALNDEVIDIHTHDQMGATVMLASGDLVEADQVVLATGNQQPADLPSAASLRFDSRYCSDPWHDWHRRLPARGGRIVLLGTGLTMVDIVVTLDALGWEGSIVAVSRKGMLPKSHFRGIAYTDFIPETIEEMSLQEIVELVDFHRQRLRQMGQNPDIAIDKLRPYTQRIWKSRSVEEMQVFLKEYATKWNVSRHRIAASIHETITRLLDSGKLKIVSGNIERIVSHDDHLEVSLHSHNSESSVQTGDLVINCTGPHSQFSRSKAPLFANLLKNGVVCCDKIDMGIQTTEDFAVLDAEGAPSSVLYAIGPLLKGSLWETTAVPELRNQAMRVAEILLEKSFSTFQEPNIIEYFI